MRLATETQTIDGWEISFRNNVHMYCHRLAATKGQTQIDVPCEDTPDGHIGIWMTDLGLKRQARDSLATALDGFFSGLGSAYKIYGPEEEEPE